MLKFFSALLLISLLGLVFHSFTQVDPGLHLFSWPWFISWQDEMVQFGLWSRPASGILFVTCLGLSFVSFLYLLANWQKISFGHLVFLVGGIALLSLLYFPAGVSHDIYNYIIYAKILVTYQQNPLTVAPNVFSGDALLPFVHWATSPSRYGPVWIFFSSLAYLVGRPSLWAVFLGFKIFYLVTYLSVGVLLSKLSTQLKLSRQKVLIFWLLNPYVILESLFSFHTDTLVGLFLLLSIGFFLNQKFSKGWLAFLASAGVKIVSLPLLIPLFLKQFFWLKAESFLKACVLFSYLGSAIIIAKWSINPWYFTIPILLSALLVENKFLRILAISLSIASEIRYAPFFFMGYFDPSIKIRVQLFIIAMLPFAFWWGWEFWRKARLRYFQKH